jgi:hypothetical protein
MPVIDVLFFAAGVNPDAILLPAMNNDRLLT